MQITINQTEGGFAVAVDGQEPQVVQGVEQVCEIVESTLGQPEQQEPMMDGEEELVAGFKNVRGGGING